MYGSSPTTGSRVSKKILLMGPKRAGKTSMRSIIFANLIPTDTRKLVATIDVVNDSVKFLGNLDLNVWDCGGQHSYQKQHLTTGRQNIFSNVAVMLYVFDVGSKEMAEDIDFYKGCLSALAELSPDAHIFCFVHKMDLIPEDLRDITYAKNKQKIEQHSGQKAVECYSTSIWDETLYKAWSAIVHSLIPNIQKIEQRLTNFCEISDSVEVVLFEHSSFLVVAHVTIDKHLGDGDVHRFEKISNIVKRFKLTCGKLGSPFKNIKLQNENFSGFLEKFTANTYILVITNDKNVKWAITTKNIRQVRPHFERYLSGV